jgi:hypothetical protein
MACGPLPVRYALHVHGVFYREGCVCNETVLPVRMHIVEGAGSEQAHPSLSDTPYTYSVHFHREGTGSEQARLISSAAVLHWPPCCSRQASGERASEQPFACKMHTAYI